MEKDDVGEEFQNLMDFFNGMALKGAFANALLQKFLKLKKSQEYMTLQILMDEARREERKIGRAEGADKHFMHPSGRM